MSGNLTLLARIHRHCRGLEHSLRIGPTHWQDAAASAGKLSAANSKKPIGPKPELFFAPDYARDRVAHWGAPVFERRTGVAWLAMLHWTDSWLKVRIDNGEVVIADAYLAALNGLRPVDVSVLIFARIQTIKVPFF